MSKQVWRAECQYCDWHEEDVKDREYAILLGGKHSGEEHANEYAFRVQMIRYGGEDEIQTEG